MHGLLSFFNKQRKREIRKKKAMLPEKFIFRISHLLPVMPAVKHLLNPASLFMAGWN